MPEALSLRNARGIQDYGCKKGRRTAKDPPSLDWLFPMPEA